MSNPLIPYIIGVLMTLFWFGFSPSLKRDSISNESHTFAIVAFCVALLWPVFVIVVLTFALLNALFGEARS